MPKRRKERVKKREREASQNIPSAPSSPTLPPPDNPYLRHKGTKFDITSTSEGKPLAKLRVAALKQAREMIKKNKTVKPHVAPTPGISNWVQLGPVAIPNGQASSPLSTSRVLVTGRVTSIVIDPTHPRTIYIGTAQGGVWKTEDGGTTWSTTTDDQDSLAIGALAMDPHNQFVLYAGTGEGNFSGDSYYGNGILKTTDGGINWTSLASTTFSGSRFSRIVVNPSTPTTIFAAIAYSLVAPGVQRSTDGGVTWTKMTTGSPTDIATDIVIDPIDTNYVYAAFSGDGIYKTTNANAVTPTWTKLTTGLPSTNFTRIALGISPSSPNILYALMADGDLINQFYETPNFGESWNSIPLPGGSLSVPGLQYEQGYYNLNVTVDPTTPDIVYLQGVSIWKAIRDFFTNVWTITRIGDNIHADNHALAIDPTNNLIIYAGNDGGIYRSDDGGATWDDSINKGFCITQFEFMDQHPSSDAFVIAGTQDNGTEAFCNDPVFKHMDDGDGGFTAIDSVDPNIVYHDFFNASPTRSTLGGRFGSWNDIGGPGSGLDCTSFLFYSPLALDQTNPNNIAFGCDKIAIDSMGGTSGWPIDVTLPSLGGDLVSAINYVNSNQIYAGTSGGKVYRLTRSGTVWAATAVHATPLPSRYIWDISVTSDFVVVVMSGFGTAHVWRGLIKSTAPFDWSDISGTPPARLPDIPVNALVIDHSIMYVGTDVGVFRTLDGGTTWTNFSEGLPNCAVFDMRLHSPTRLLRAVTHGRGMWERKLDVTAMPDVDIFVRHNLMDTGRFTPTPGLIQAAFEDPTEYVSLGDQLHWFECADIKVDALEGTPLSYQIPNVADVDYVAFESVLKHHSAQKGRINRVYVQVHNRGIKRPQGPIFAKLLYADVPTGVLPPLPSDFWTKSPNDSTVPSKWKPIGEYKEVYFIPYFTTIPEIAILEWEWKTPSNASDHTCLLVVVDAIQEDPIPSANKVFDVNTLASMEKHVGLKNAFPIVQPKAMYWTKFQFLGNPKLRYSITISTSRVKEWSIGLMFQKSKHMKLDVKGVTVKEPTQAMLFELKKKIGEEIKKYDTSKVYVVDDTAKGGTLAGIKLPEKELQSMLLFVPPNDTVSDGTVSIALLHEDQGIIGGSKFVLRTIR